MGFLFKTSSGYTESQNCKSVDGTSEAVRLRRSLAGTFGDPWVGKGLGSSSGCLDPREEGLVSWKGIGSTKDGRRAGRQRVCKERRSCPAKLDRSRCGPKVLDLVFLGQLFLFS